MNRLAVIAITLTVSTGTVGFYSSAAFALGHVALGKHSMRDIRSHCDAAGGKYYNSDGVFGCFGPGGDVTCSAKTKRCFGTCENCGAARLAGSDALSGILTQRGFFGWWPDTRQSHGRFSPF
jgi:hypothetical protein